MVKTNPDEYKIISLWQESFGDSEAEIRYFIDNVKDAACYAYEEDGRLLSMLYLVSCRICGKNGGYVYAACTAENSRGKGIMTRLLDSVAADYNGCICLIPANEGLINYYGERGFTETADIEELKFNQSDGIQEYLFDGFDLDKPIVLIRN